MRLSRTRQEQQRLGRHFEATVENQQIYILDSDEAAAHDVHQLVSSVYPNVKRCENIADFYQSYDAENAGCLITEFKLNGGSGLEVLRELKERKWLIATVVLTAHADVPSTVRAMHLGAVTVIEKPYRDIDLWQNINTALSFVRRCRQKHHQQQALLKKIDALTSQEREIVQLIVDGFPNKVIAARMDVSLRTIESRRKSIYQTLAVDNVAEFVGLIHQANTPICRCTLKQSP